jgi:hypothetical protein
LSDITHGDVPRFNAAFAFGYGNNVARIRRRFRFVHSGVSHGRPKTKASKLITHTLRVGEKD